MGQAPTPCVIECFVLGVAQTHLLFSHKKSKQKKLLTAVPMPSGSKMFYEVKELRPAVRSKLGIMNYDRQCGAN